MSITDSTLPAAFRHQPGSIASRNAVDTAERQIQRWLLVQKAQNHVAELRTAKSTMGIDAFLTISREAGTGGSQIARLVGNAIGWDVLDREILEFIAENYHISRDILNYVDETTSNWITEIVRHLIVPASVSQLQYVHRVSRMILTAAHAGKTIFVGRGAQFLLPREHGLRVRIIAPLPYRVKQEMELAHISFGEATAYVTKTDAGRRDYARQYFGHDIADPHLYDLVINVEHIGPQQAAHVIANTLISCVDLELRKKVDKEQLIS